MHKHTYTNGHFETWQTCKKKYYLKYEKNLRVPDKLQDFELGKNIHALMNYYLRGLDISHFERNLDEETEKHWISIKNHPILKNKLINAEWGFNARIADTKYWLTGRIDAIFNDENKIIIADWKTGQNLPKNAEASFQTMTYLYSLYRAQKDLKIETDHENLSFVYIKTPECLEKKIEYSKEKETLFENQFVAIINQIENYKFDNSEFQRADKNCKYCQFNKFCFAV